MKFIVFSLLATLFIGTESRAEEVKSSATCIGVTNNNEYIDSDYLEAYGETKEVAFEKLVGLCRLHTFRDRSIVQNYLVIEYTIGAKRVASQVEPGIEKIVNGLFILDMVEADAENSRAKEQE
ncbi:MAG: hypothetical protein H6625_12225 [Bdellovibrionaceae bacterium]|nr:hypothetical protein [Pseudobdellovibrionaceae bacterium]